MRKLNLNLNGQLSSEKRVVFVVGAGFSTEFGYPMARELLARVWPRLNQDTKKGLKKVIKFHHPDWDSRPATLPEIEELLTELAANEDLLPSLRPGGPFSVEKLRDLRQQLLFEIANWFHKIHSKAANNAVIEEFAHRVKLSGASIISFNWDYELDKALFPKVTTGCYGLAEKGTDGLVLLKPHGSLNWYLASLGRRIIPERRVKLWTGQGGDESVYCFLRWRAPKSKRRRYVPWIVPPTHLKDFRHGMLRHIWKKCVDLLSVASEVYFLGYSLPPADWHSRYIFRCGFYNQEDGLPLNGDRAAPTGRAQVRIVNPDRLAFRRIESIVGWKCRWIPKKVGQWLNAGE